MLPNVVLIVADTLRAGSSQLVRLSEADHATPRSARAARRPLSPAFSQANATHPSFTTIFSGLDPLSHGVVGQLAPSGPTRPHATMAERLASIGYRTAAVDTLGRWFRTGFERYETYTYSHAVLPPGESLRTAEEATDLALPLINEISQSAPFFLTVHYWDPHTAYYPPPPYNTAFLDESARAGEKILDRLSFFPPVRQYYQQWIHDDATLEYVISQYDGEVGYLDEQIGRLLEHTHRVSPPESTLVIFTADHGESMDEHDIYFCHYALYDQLIQVPLIFKWPGQILSGHVVDGFARHTDILPTLLSLLGQPAADGMDGISLAEQLKEASAPPISTPIVFSCEGSWQVKLAARTEEWKLVHTPLPGLHQ